jgi:hypothetical protein
MKITHVEAIPVDRYLFVQVSTDSGLVGLGEAGTWGFSRCRPGAEHGGWPAYFRAWSGGNDLQPGRGPQWPGGSHNPVLQQAEQNQGYTGSGKTWIGQHLGWRVEVVRHPPHPRGEWVPYGDLARIETVWFSWLPGGVAVERDHTAEFDDQQHTSAAIF